ncbi:flavin-containing monooxygenase [Frankia gtarii]|uniref:flavin-containing monooxygenase n=1 Tax=Frankia gtarii TaxID=2950102 RepID=UPI0021C03A3D|nr:NAD(P)/FAD-dependent oxidoreductase [Frankia gtarii]
MQLDFDRQTITDDDETIRAATNGVLVAPLLAAVAHLTGDYDLLREDLRPEVTHAPAPPEAGYSDAQLELARKLAAEALIRFRDAGCVAAPAPDQTRLRQLVEFVAGHPVGDDHLALLAEELALGGVDLRAPTWRIDETATDGAFTVAVIGAGMSGILAAHRLSQAGARVHVFEKNDDVGGTWLENDYPGCRVDVQNHLYSYSFAQSCHWPQFNSPQPVLHDYFRTCVEEFGVRDAISFQTEVLEARWDDSRRIWVLKVRDGAGVERSVEANAVVSAVGQLNRPSMPNIAGIDSFRGQSFHSARWDHDVDLTGKRVAVIGTGASAVQFIPWLAERAGHLTIHQRTPAWLLPVANYQDDLPVSLEWLLRHVPEFARWDRLAVFARLQEGMLPLAVVDPDWDISSGSVSAANDTLRQMLAGYYELMFPDPELRAKVLPTYPFGSKRMIVDNGSYARTLQRPDVTLETAPIAEITGDGLRMEDGRDLGYDVIVYGTGFQASRFLTPMRVIGPGGADLHGTWDGDARAYLGLTVPGFPNLFLLYGPNTNIVVNGSITYFSECGTRYITECVRLLHEHHRQAMDVRKTVHDDYNKRVDEATDQRAWGVSTVNTWYRNERGRIAQNWPFNLHEYWRLTRTPNADDYDFV